MQLLDVNHNRLTALPGPFVNMELFETILADYNDLEEAPACVLDLPSTFKMLMIAANPRIHHFFTVDQLKHFRKLTVAIDEFNSPSFTT